MKINLGPPYEATIKRTIEKSMQEIRIEVIRQTILAYEHMLEEEELTLAHRAVAI